MKRFCLFLFLLTFYFGAFAQKAPKIFKDFGKVTVSDFAETDYDDLGFDAVILFNERKVYFDSFIESLRFFDVNHCRLKVLNDSFLDNDFFQINYSGKFDYEKIISAKLNIYSCDGKKVSCVKLKSKQVKRIDNDSIISKMVFELPQVKKGDIIDFEYVLVTFDFMLPPAYDFNFKYPCLNSQMVASFPDNMRYKFDVIEENNGVNHSYGDGFQTISYAYSPQDNPNSIYYMQGRSRKFLLNFKFQTNVDTFSSSYILPVDFTENKFNSSSIGHSRVTMKAAKFTQNVNYTHPIYLRAWDQMTHLMFVYQDPDNRELSQHEAWFKLRNSGFVIVNSDSWQLLHKRMRKSPYFCKPLMKSFPLNSDLQAIADNSEFTERDVTIKKIYDYVAANILWDSTFSNHINNSPEKVLKNGIGSSAEINMTLVYLLRRAGIDAFPALGATSDFGRIDTSYANEIQFNTVFAVVRMNNNSCFLMDCSMRNHPYNKLPMKDFNNFCWAVAPESDFFIEFEESDFE